MRAYIVDPSISSNGQPIGGLKGFIKILQKLVWKKSMKWGDNDLYWGRPLKSIMSVFDHKPLKFKFYHLTSSNLTYVEKDFEEKTKSFKNFNSYLSYFGSRNIIIDNEKRKNKIEKELVKFSKKKILKFLLIKVC